jgi:hypothetical protein
MLNSQCPILKSGEKRPEKRNRKKAQETQEGMEAET